MATLTCDLSSVTERARFPVSSLHSRSLGSVALRKAETMENKLHLNVFTVDFNEELVALYGGSLYKQTRFLHECIKAILRLYKVRPRRRLGNGVGRTRSNSERGGDTFNGARHE